MLDAVWGMVGGDEGIESGVPNPSKNLPVWSSNAPLPKKKEKRIGNTKYCHYYYAHLLLE